MHMQQCQGTEHNRADGGSGQPLHQSTGKHSQINMAGRPAQQIKYGIEKCVYDRMMGIDKIRRFRIPVGSVSSLLRTVHQIIDHVEGISMKLRRVIHNRPEQAYTKNDQCGFPDTFSVPAQ